MPPRQDTPESQAPLSQSVRALRDEIEALGARLADDLVAVFDRLPRRVVGPQVLATTLDTTMGTASRVLKALAQNDPLATLQLIPGPNPLRRIVEAARAKGVEGGICDTALESVAAFDHLIRTVAGDRSGFKATISAWLPQERREFEAKRRQAIFRGRSELDGASCDLEVTCLILAPSEKPGRVDIVNIQTAIGIDRIRPDAIVQLGTFRVPVATGMEPEAEPRIPTNLDGEPALDGVHSVRLDQFCSARPAPLVTRQHGMYMEYSLGPTGFGASSKVDLVIAELNRAELPQREPDFDTPPFFYTIPDLPARKLVFDLLVHRDLYRGSGPSLLTYDTFRRGPARAADPARELDLRRTTDEIEHLNTGLRGHRLIEFPRYHELLTYSFEKLAFDPSDFRSYRVAIHYPLNGTQVCLCFRGEHPAAGAGGEV